MASSDGGVRSGFGRRSSGMRSRDRLTLAISRMTVRAAASSGSKGGGGPSGVGLAEPGADVVVTGYLLIGDHASVTAPPSSFTGDPANQRQTAGPTRQMAGTAGRAGARQRVAVGNPQMVCSAGAPGEAAWAAGALGGAGRSRCSWIGLVPRRTDST